MLLPLTAMAQTPTFDALFHEYSTKEDCTTINISNAMLKSMEVSIEAEYMQVIAIESESLISTFQAQADKVLSGLEVIMSVSSGGKSVCESPRKLEAQSVPSTLHGTPGIPLPRQASGAPVPGAPFVVGTPSRCASDLSCGSSRRRTYRRRRWCFPYTVCLIQGLLHG